MQAGMGEKLKSHSIPVGQVLAPQSSTQMPSGPPPWGRHSGTAVPSGGCGQSAREKQLGAQVSHPDVKQVDWAGQGQGP